MSYVLIQLAFVTFILYINVVNLSNRIVVLFLHPSHGIVMFTYRMTKRVCSTVLSMGYSSLSAVLSKVNTTMWIWIEKSSFVAF